MSNTALTELLASYVPQLIQNRVLANPAPIESPVAEEVQAAILFADISGFTLLTEKLAEKGPTGVETLARILNEYFGQLIDIIHEYGGDVVKFAGDGVIAVWPIVSDLPVPEDLTRAGIVQTISRADQWQWTMRVAECALKIRERLTNYKVCPRGRCVQSLGVPADRHTSCGTGYCQYSGECRRSSCGAFCMETDQE